ncbi:protein ABHD18 [Centruroides vittatus]|uniref:protein ABHD18 n=1 Tax=Centruroides vittatus TaxID=120091 RepID=UPI00351039BC
MSSTSKLDTVYRRILLTKFFTKGWGKTENFKRLFAFRKIISNRETCQKLVRHDYPIKIDKVENCSHYKILEGHFLSPFVQYIPEVVPKEVETARFQMLLPTKWPKNHLKPVCLHLAGTGDHFFWRRRILMAKPLLKHGIASILLENPFYGLRKPTNQRRSSLHNVSDIFVMGGCLVLESLALFHWCEAQGFGPLAITGISMGGHMASLAGSNWHKPLAIIPCLSWTTASCVFTQGVMSGAIPWSLLQSQYFSDQVYKDEIWNLIHSPEENDAFSAGCHFARNYPESMEQMKKLQAEQNGPVIQTYKEKNVSQLGSLPTVTDEKWNNDKPLLSPYKSSQKSYLSSSYSTSFRDETEHKVTDNIDQNAGVKSNKLKAALPFLFSETLKETLRLNKKISDSSDILKQETLNFMRGIMDECTHLGNFTIPVDPTLTIVVAAQRDGYVLRQGIKSLSDLWSGCEVRYLDCGHIEAFLFNQGVFRKAIIDALERTAEKYFNSTV